MLPVGGLVGNATDPAQLGVAILLAPELASSGTTGPCSLACVRGTGGQAAPAAVFSGFGPGGGDIAARLAVQAGQWAGCGRPGARDLQLTVRPAGAGRWPAPGGPGSLVLRRPSVTIEAGWPHEQQRV